MPLNGPASYSANINFFANVPLKNTGFTIGNMTRLGYNHSASYVGSDIDTGKYIKTDGSLDYNLFFGDYDQIRPKLEENKTNSFSIMERLRVSYRSDNVEVELSGRTRINHTNYQLASTSDQTTTFNNQVRANVNWTFAPIALTVKPEFNYNWYNGYATQQPSEYLLNLEVQKQILHGLMTLSLKGYDLLGQAKNLTVTDTANYHTETVNNTLGRYIVMSLTVRFGSFKGHGGQGGPHGMGGGPRGR